ncbi:MATE family efflux transporter [Halolamina sp.]|jgi:putative MATE family efflux protein|uniref:MATE family efflux transporter n=1 Tax=Halolamina sp. TaxID=1940283 RepID=UPI000223C06E|nr:MATE efflux family protein [halophilic archaeon DL31]
MFDLEPEEITEGSIPRALIFLAVPLVAQNLVQVINAAADVFWLGRLGDGAVGAVGLNQPVIALLTVPIMTAMVGTQVLVSQRIGADDEAGARRAVFHGIVLAFVSGLVLTVVLQPNTRVLVDMLGAGPGVAPEAAAYLSAYLLLFPFIVVSDTVEQGFIGAGDSKVAMYLNFLAIAINLVLDPLLIFGYFGFPELGVAGAALASVLGYTAAMVFGFYFLLGGRQSLSLTLADVGLDIDEFREMVDIGAPIGGQRLAAQSVRLFVVAIVAIVGGAPGLAAYTVGARIATIAFVPARGLQQAGQSVIGQNLGADRPDRAARTTWVGVAIAVGALTLVGIVQYFVPELLTAIFVPDISARGLELSVRYLEVLAYGYWAIGATYMLLAGLNGARRTKTSLFVDLGKYWGLRFPIAVAALPAGYAVSVLGVSVAPGLGLGMEAIFWAVTGSNIVAALALGVYFRYATNTGMLERAAETAADSVSD